MREVTAAEFQARKAAKQTKRKKFKANSVIGKEDRKRNRQPGVGLAASAYIEKGSRDTAFRPPVERNS